MIIISNPYRFRRKVVIQSLSDVILSTEPFNLVGYYKCDESSGSLIDSSGNNNTLLPDGIGHVYSLTGAPGLGDAVTGSGTGGWFNTTSSTKKFVASTGLTFGAVVKRNVLSPTTSDPVNGISDTLSAQTFEVGIRAFNPTIFRETNGVTSPSTLDFTILPNDTTNYAIYTCRVDPSTPSIDVFVNGTNVATLILTTIFLSLFDIMNILSLSPNGVGSGVYADCNIQHSFFYNITLTDLQIQAIHSASNL